MVGTTTEDHKIARLGPLLDDGTPGGREPMLSSIKPARSNQGLEADLIASLGRAAIRRTVLKLERGTSPEHDRR